MAESSKRIDARRDDLSDDSTPSEKRARLGVDPGLDSGNPSSNESGTISPPSADGAEAVRREQEELETGAVTSSSRPASYELAEERKRKIAGLSKRLPDNPPDEHMDLDLGRPGGSNEAHRSPSSSQEVHILTDDSQDPPMLTDARIDHDDSTSSSSTSTGGHHGIPDDLPAAARLVDDKIAREPDEISQCSITGSILDESNSVPELIDMRLTGPLVTVHSSTSSSPPPSARRHVDGRRSGGNGEQAEESGTPLSSPEGDGNDDGRRSGSNGEQAEESGTPLSSPEGDGNDDGRGDGQGGGGGAGDGAAGGAAGGGAAGGDAGGGAEGGAAGGGAGGGAAGGGAGGGAAGGGGGGGRRPNNNGRNGNNDDTDSTDRENDDEEDPHQGDGEEILPGNGFDHNEPNPVRPEPFVIPELNDEPAMRPEIRLGIHNHVDALDRDEHGRRQYQGQEQNPEEIAPLVPSESEETTSDETLPTTTTTTTTTTSAETEDDEEELALHLGVIQRQNQMEQEQRALQNAQQWIEAGAAADEVGEVGVEEALAADSLQDLNLAPAVAEALSPRRQQLVRRMITESPVKQLGSAGDLLDYQVACDEAIPIAEAFRDIPIPEHLVAKAAKAKPFTQSDGIRMQESFMELRKTTDEILQAIPGPSRQYHTPSDHGTPQTTPEDEIMLVQVAEQLLQAVPGSSKDHGTPMTDVEMTPAEMTDRAVPVEIAEQEIETIDLDVDVPKKK